MALSNDSSSQALLDKLDELLVDCTPQEVENAHGVDYTVGLDELKKVTVARIVLPSSSPQSEPPHCMVLVCDHPLKLKSEY